MVQDSAGANLTAIIKKEVKVCPAGQVLYQSGITTGAGMFKMNPDGGSKQAFHVSPYDRGNPVGCNEGWASASIDGSRLAFCSARPDVVGGPFQTTNQIYVTDRSGNGCFRVSDLPHGCEMPSISPLGDLVAYRYSLGGNSHYCVVNTDPVLGNRNIYTFDSVTGADSVWSGAMTAPRRDLVFDQISWDTHCDDPDRADTLYYCKQVGASATPTGIFKVQIQRNANGQPIGIRSGSTIAPILNGVSPYGTRSPHFFMDQNQVDYLFHCLDDTDPYIASSGAGAARSGGLREEQPCPWMEGTNLRLFAVDVNAAVTPFNSTIVRFTPPMSMTAPADRVPLTSVNQAIFPVYLPPAP